MFGSPCSQRTLERGGIGALLCSFRFAIAHHSFFAQRITAEFLEDVAEERKGWGGMYITPSATTSLHLQHLFIGQIENLDEYKNVKNLYLNQNLLTRIENVAALTQLRKLELNENNIERIENLALPTLVDLSIRNNGLESLDGIQDAPKLRILRADENKIGSIAGLKELKEIEFVSLVGNKVVDIEPLRGSTVRSLNLKRNKITDGDAVLSILASMKELRVLYMKGNPFVPKLKDYRKRIISACPALTFLDDRKVEGWERRYVEAYLSGGQPALEIERKRHNEEKASRQEKAMERWKQARAEAREKYLAEKKREEAAASAAPGGDEKRPPKGVEVVNVDVDDETPSEAETTAPRSGEQSLDDDTFFTAEVRRLSAAGKSLVQVVWRGGVGVRASPADAEAIGEVLSYGTVLELKEGKGEWIHTSRGWSKAMAAENMPAFRPYTKKTKKRAAAESKERADAKATSSATRPSLNIKYKRTARESKAQATPVVQSVTWDSKKDARLVELCRSLAFDFSAVCREARAEWKRAGVKGTAALTADACRQRYATIDKAEQKADAAGNGYDPDNLDWDNEDPAIAAMEP